MKTGEEINPTSRGLGKAVNEPFKGLTPIPRRIHCGATQDATEGGYSEADMIIVKNFLNTLAEVALAVAVRNAQRHDEQD